MTCYVTWPVRKPCSSFGPFRQLCALAHDQNPIKKRLAIHSRLRSLSQRKRFPERHHAGHAFRADQKDRKAACLARGNDHQRAGGREARHARGFGILLRQASPARNASSGAQAVCA